MTRKSNLIGLAALVLGLNGCNYGLKFRTPNISPDVYHNYHIESKEDLRVGYLKRPIYISNSNYESAALNNQAIHSYLRRLNKSNSDVEVKINYEEKYSRFLEDNKSYTLEKRAKELLKVAVDVSVGISNPTVALNRSQRSEVLDDDIDIIALIIDRDKLYIALIGIKGE